MDEKLYFAYGSNMNLDQMAQRAPLATPVAPVTLEGYTLAFRASGVATIIPKEGESVSGMLWEITQECEEALDWYEGYPNFYGKESVTVRDKNNFSYKVMAYVMTPERARNPALPPQTYFTGILEGYKRNGINTDKLFKALTRTVREIEEYENNKLHRQKQAQFGSFKKMKLPKPPGRDR